MSLLAVAAAAENLLKKQRWSAAAFSAKKTAALPLVAGDEKKQRRYRYRKSSGASSARWWTAPLCPSLPRTQRGSVFQKKGLRSKYSQVFRKLQAISKKTKKRFSPTNSQIFHKVRASKIVFASSLTCSKTKQHCSWHWHIFNRSKNSAVLEPRTCKVRGQS